MVFQVFKSKRVLLKGAILQCKPSEKMPLTAAWEPCKTCQEQASETMISFDVKHHSSSGSDRMVFHPSCVTCYECFEMLVNFQGYEFEGELYCGRCHAEKLLPRCGGCDEVLLPLCFLLLMIEDLAISPFRSINYE